MSQLQGHESGILMGGITYTTLDPLKKGTAITLSNGNLTATQAQAAGDWWGVLSVAPVTARKSFWVVRVVSARLSGVPARALAVIGVRNAANSLEDYPFAAGDSGCWYYQTGQTFKGLTPKACGAALNISDDVMIALDPAVGIWFGINGTWQNVSAQTDPANGLNPQYTRAEIPGDLYAFVALEDGTLAAGGASRSDVDFGNNVFYGYTPPSGFSGVF